MLHRSRMLSAWLLFGSMVAAGCGSQSEPRDTSDAGTDSGTTDVGDDSGTTDVGDDSGTTDVGDDSGTTDVGGDSGTTDSSATDSSTMESGTMESGTTDPSTPDAGLTGPVIYLDAVHGDDGRSTSSSAQPWKTMNRARAAAQPGTTVVLRTGNYGSVTFTNGDASGTSWAAPILYIADTGADARFELLKVSGAGDKYLVFEGLHVQPAKRPDPMVQVVAGVRHVRFRKLTVNSFSGFYADNAAGTAFSLEGGTNAISAIEDIAIEESEAFQAWGGVEGSGFVKNVRVSRNHIHDTMASAIRFWEDCEEIVIDGNHIHDQRDDWATDPHGSGISLRSHRGITVRNNRIHDYGTTAGLRVYPDGAPPYNDYLIENNLVYNPHGVSVTGYVTAAFYLIGSNFVVRNNTFVENLTLTFADGLDGSSLSFHNNIVEELTLEELEAEHHWPSVHEEKNVLKSVIRRYQKAGGEFEWTKPNTITPTTTSVILEGSSYGAAYYASQLFQDASARDYRLKATSIAVNLADPAQAPATDLDGKARGDRPDVGCYEGP